VVSKEQLAEQLYGWEEEVGANAIEVYVHRFAQELEPAGVTVRTIRGLGYLLEKAGMTNTRTLRTRLLLWVSGPLLTLWVISTLIDHDVARVSSI